jgi:hypothetical protein
MLTEAILDQRLRDVSQVTLGDMLDRLPRLRRLSVPLHTSIEARRRALAAELASVRYCQALAESMAEGFGRYLGLEHQYVQLDADTEQRLLALYRGLAARFGQALAQPDWTLEVERLLSEHHESLRAEVRRALVACGAWQGEGEPLVRPVCAQYPADLQLQLLGLDVATLAEPVLDLGCGEDGLLVHYLRRLGVEAWGLDRHADADPYLVRGDWFSPLVSSRSWGTIIAHQSFSLHFLHAHLRSEALAVRYARAYMTYLSALRPGGQFVYAPGLPFIEGVLPAARFAVTTRPLPLQGWTATTVRHL